jgi:ferric-dicitrate binding protein FerR (iron transport regulator)
MTMDLIRSTNPPTARVWRYWARVWTLFAAMSAIIGLIELAVSPERRPLWSILLIAAAVSAVAAMLVWAGARRRG